MSSLYRYFQRIGGTEPWTPIQAHLSIDEIRPTFVTVLAIDTLLEDDTPKDVKAKAKYSGPMYFDLDADDIADSIAGAQELVNLLLDHDLQACDLLIYLSGKKGLHILIPEVCFTAKPGTPVQNLPAVYKEMAYKFAVDTVDFRVYTAKKGRQFRTCYNVRENGNYKVPISLAELQELTPETYNELCKSPRTVAGHAPQWRGKFALAYDAALQKVGKVKPKVSKPVPPEVLRQQLPIFTKIATAETPADVGFNVLAIQLCLYAREMKWQEDFFIQQCQGVIEKHDSDGSRYNSPARRERELRRMFVYLEDNTSFEYSSGGLKSCAKVAKSENFEEYYSESSDFEEPEDSHFAGVYAGATAYMASKGEDGDVKITNFLFRDIVVLLDLQTDSIVQLRGKVSRNREASLLPGAFTGGTALQNAVSSFGGSFSGTDIHARGIYQSMLREAKQHQYIIDSEGVNLIKVGSPEKKEYVLWADREGVKSASDMVAEGVHVTFQGFPDSRGLFQTDLTSAPSLDEMLSEEASRERLIKTVKAMLNSHTAEVMGKSVGWAISCFYAPLFHSVYKQFPMLHVYGPSGNGKSSTVSGLLRHFYYREDSKSATPNSTIFAFQQMLSGSSSIPMLLDEYKPHKMTSEKLESFRAALRDAYNAKTVQRGGGNKNNKDNFNALGTMKLSAPVVFVAEAPETETAIVERSVMVSFKRLAGKEQSDAFKNAMVFQRDTEPLASLGLEIANTVVQTNSAKQSLESFDRALTWAYKKFLPDPDDWDKVERGEMTQEDMRTRAIMRPRPVFNSTVAFFGLQVLKSVLTDKLGEQTYLEHFDERVKDMSRACFVGMADLAEATLPEYVKVLTMFSDMTKFTPDDNNRLIEGVEYNLSELGGQPVLVIAPRQAYMKYRTYMRHTGSQPLYPSDESFLIALREIPQYIKPGFGTKRLEAATAILDLEGLYRAAVPRFDGKAIDLGL